MRGVFLKTDRGTPSPYRISWTSLPLPTASVQPLLILNGILRVGLRWRPMRNTRVALTALGGPEVLKVVDDDVRDPVANELRIRILACGVAFADVLMRRGLYSGVPPLPYSPGYDIVGVVESCGAGVTQWKP